MNTVAAMERTSLPDLPPDHPCAACDIRLRTFCSTLDARELEQFRCMGTVVQLSARQPLFHEGDRADLVHNVTRGMLKLYKLLPDGRRQVMGFVQAGDFLGITLDEEHAFTAEALEPVELCRFPRHRFDAFLEEHPRMERELYRLAAHELAAAQEQMVVLGRKTANERIASFLIMLLRRSRSSLPAETVRLPMSRLDIADYLGLTKETVSRGFTSFKTGGLIRLLNDHAVRILDRKRLEHISTCG